MLAEITSAITSAKVALDIAKAAHGLSNPALLQKKSKQGIATPKEDMDIIRARLKVAEAWAKELRDENTSH